jgi:glycosyltransferase involved in cell wall biosynthesis
MAELSTPDVTVVVPVHNEADYLPTALPMLLSEMEQVGGGVRILMVENGSTDATASLIRAAMEEHPDLALLQLETPDYGAAMRAGFLAGRGEWVVNFDIDYFSAAFLNDALALGDSADLVLASKRAVGADDRRGAWRRFATWTFNQILRYALGSSVSDTHGMKLVRRSVVDSVGPSVRSTTDLFDTELVVRAERAGFRIVELPASVEELRQAKSSLVKRVPRTLKGVWAIRRALRAERP